MATAAGSVAGPAGLFNNFIIERFQLFGGKSVFDAFTLAQARIMKGFGVILSRFDMTDSAGFEVIGRSGYPAFVSRFFCFSQFVSLMTGNAVHRQMKIPADEIFIDQVPFVIFFRPNRGRSASSPLGLTADFRRLHEGFHFTVACVAPDATSSVGFGCQ